MEKAFLQGDDTTPVIEASKSLPNFISSVLIKMSINAFLRKKIQRVEAFFPALFLEIWQAFCLYSWYFFQ